MRAVAAIRSLIIVRIQLRRFFAGQWERSTDVPSPLFPGIDRASKFAPPYEQGVYLSEQLYSPRTVPQFDIAIPRPSQFPYFLRL